MPLCMRLRGLLTYSLRPTYTIVTCRFGPVISIPTFSVILTSHHSLTNHDSCPTRRTAARPIPEGMTIFCLFMVPNSSAVGLSNHSWSRYIHAELSCSSYGQPPYTTSIANQTNPPQRNLGRARRSRTTTQQSPHWLRWDAPRLPFPFDDHRPSNTPIPRPTPLTTPNGIQIQSVFLPQYTFRAVRPTHRPTDGLGDRSVRRALTLAVLIDSDAHKNCLISSSTSQNIADIICYLHSATRVCLSVIGGLPSADKWPHSFAMTNRFKNTSICFCLNNVQYK